MDGQVTAFAVIPANDVAERVQGNDSVLNDKRMALKAEKNLGKKAELAKAITLALSAKGDTAEAFQYAMMYIHLTDSLKKDAAMSAKAKKQGTSVEKDNDEEKFYDLDFFIPFSIFIILMLCYIIFVILHFFRKKRQRMIKTIQSISEERNKVIKHNKDIKDRIDADRKLRADSAQDISVVRTDLQKICDDPKVSLQPDMWDVVFDAVDKLYPDFRGRLLSYNPGLKNKDLVLVYLMKLGFKQADVARMMKRDPSVIWRKFKRIEGTLGVSLDQALRDNGNNDEN